MKKLLNMITSIFLSAIILSSAVAGAFAVESTPDEASDGFITLYVTAKDIAESSFRLAVQNALNTARDEADGDNKYKVKVEEGDYLLDGGLRIFSNTTLSLYGVTLKKVSALASNIVRIGNEDSVSRGVTGYYYENITIEGGELDADFKPGTMIKAAHAKNFMMKDITLKNLKNHHMMEVAGVDGFTLKNCSFNNQQLDNPDGDVCYEAVQIDVLKEGHIVNCRSEDIPVKNILVEGCSFDNCPRAIGSHTAILNNPFDNIVIRNNRFTNMTSVAIQTVNWTNCAITDNYIENTPRAIALYATRTDGKKMFLPGALAEEGGTEPHAVDNYIAPKNSNTLIAYNTILNCGTVEDTYGDFAVSAISAIGYDLTESKPEDIFVPKGNYWADGITVHDNFVDVKGTACRLNDAKNVKIYSNVFNCGNNPFKSTQNYYGVVARLDSEVSYIENNYIKNAKVDGIYIAEGCKIGNVNYNAIDTAEKYGIAVYNSTVDKICDNDIKACKKGGVGLLTSTVVKQPVERNKISSCEMGIYFPKNSSGTVRCNTLDKCTTPISYSKTSFSTTVINNYKSLSADSGIFTDVNSIELKKGRSYKLRTESVPLNSRAAVTYKSSDSAVASVNEAGMITAVGMGAAVITVQSSSGKNAAVNVTVNDEKHDTVTKAAAIVSSVGTIYNNTNGVNLQWSKVSGAVKYRVFRKTTANWAKITETTSLSCVDKNVVSGTAYTYTVRALASNGSYIGTYDTIGAKITYVAPAVINRLENSAGKITIGWKKIAGASYYRLFYKTGASGWTSLGATANLTKSFSPVKSGTAYSFMIISNDSNKDMLNYYNKNGWTRTYLSKPSLKKAVSGKKIKLTWNKITGAKKYILRVLKLQKKSRWKTLKTTAKTSYSCKGGYGKSYQFALKCVDKSGKSFSSYSDYKTVKIKRPKPKKKISKISKAGQKNTTAQKLS